MVQETKTMDGYSFTYFQNPNLDWLKNDRSILTREEMQKLLASREGILFQTIETINSLETCIFGLGGAGHPDAATICAGHVEAVELNRKAAVGHGDMSIDVARPIRGRHDYMYYNIATAAERYRSNAWERGRTGFVFDLQDPGCLALRAFRAYAVDVVEQCRKKLESLISDVYDGNVETPSNIDTFCWKVDSIAAGDSLTGLIRTILYAQRSHDRGLDQWVPEAPPF